jgi:SIT4-associating protein SAP185/190
MPILLSFLSSEHSWATQTSAGDFLKAIITISANASQNEQSCIGPNELTRQLVSRPCVERLISDMLKGGNPLTVGVGIVIEVIRKNNSDYDPDVGADSNMAPSSRDPIYLGTLLRMFAKHVPDFMALILSPDHTSGSKDGPVTIKRKELNAAFGGKVEPLGFDRFKTCELMAELLHCSNMGLLNERGSEEFVRARDAERERLKAEGKLRVSGDRFNIDSDDLTMKSSDTSRLGSNSPEEMRRLEIQNASDDDGFEEVTHSQDLGDDPKDDFDEKSDVDDDLLANIKPESFPSFLDKDDDEFVDEPLSSPRLNIDVEPLQPSTTETSLNVQPLSPTKELSEKVEDLKVNQDESSDHPPSNDDHSKDPAVSSDEQIKKALDDAIGNQVQPRAEEKVEQSPEPTLQIPLGLAIPDDGLSPHPDDHPEPLFAKKKDVSLEEEDEAPVPIQFASQVPIPEVSSSPNLSITEIEDSTMVDADGIIPLDNIDDSKAIEIDDEFTSPVVGDHLKMQFVEHKVVPTILVGRLSDRQ